MFIQQKGKKGKENGKEKKKKNENKYIKKFTEWDRKLIGKKKKERLTEKEMKGKKDI